MNCQLVSSSIDFSFKKQMKKQNKRKLKEKRKVGKKKFVIQMWKKNFWSGWKSM